MFKKYVCHGNCEEYLQKFINSMCEGFALFEIILDTNGIPYDYRFLEVNCSFLEIAELNIDIIGKTLLDIYPDIDPQWTEIYANVVSLNTCIQFEKYFENLDKYFKISAFSPIKGQLITIFNDITDLKKADATLKKHQILFENAQDIVMYIRSDGKIIEANANAILKYGYSRKELLDMKIQDIRHSSTSEEFDEQMNKADTSGVVFECIHVRKDGSSFPVEVSARSTQIDDEILRIHIIRDITERKKSEEKILYLASYDSLTGIPNRSYLMQKFDEILEQAERGRFKFAVMLLDVNKFKMINDVYGHNAGDTVLKETANRVNNAVRKVDVLGRFGGDEFVIIQPYIKNEDDIITLAERIVKNFESPIELNTINLDLTISLGISIFPDTASDKKNLIHFADTAMYSAKQKGGNKYEFYK